MFALYGTASCQKNLTEGPFHDVSYPRINVSTRDAGVFGLPTPVFLLPLKVVTATAVFNAHSVERWCVLKATTKKKWGWEGQLSRASISSSLPCRVPWSTLLAGR